MSRCCLILIIITACFLYFSSTQEVIPTECASPVLCVTKTQFTFCYVANGVVINEGLYDCPKGYMCQQSSVEPCIEDISTTTESTTTAPITPPDTCTEINKYPAEQCNQYYECIFVQWWYELLLLTCPLGQAFENVNKTCVAADIVGCTIN